jgi:hypothetical protein
VACKQFDGQVVRLERLKDVADEFIRVRLTRIDNADLSLFDFDYDLTFMVFFLNAEGKVYARYGGRDGDSPDSRHSLDGLHYTMESVLRAHARHDKAFAPRSEAPRHIRDVAGMRRGGRCLHCHQVKEILIDDLKRRGQWSQDMMWRYPLPENLGFALDVDRGNVVKTVQPKSSAAAAGLAIGDVLQRLNDVTTHSFADAQFALDRAPRTGAVEVAWKRGDKGMEGKLSLAEGWRKSDIAWRPSLRQLVPTARLYGTELTSAEKKVLGLSPRQLAFRQREGLSAQARAAGIRAGDIIVGVDDRLLEMDLYDFLRYVERSYLIGDRVTVNVVRADKRLRLPMTLLR